VVYLVERSSGDGDDSFTVSDIHLHPPTPTPALQTDEVSSASTEPQQHIEESIVREIALRHAAFLGR
jgi:hypothetical protein